MNGPYTHTCTRTKAQQVSGTECESELCLIISHFLCLHLCRCGERVTAVI